jgi:hypothetical protein
MAMLATPPAPPWIRMVSPALSLMVSSMLILAVSPVSAIAAASICERPAGLRARIDDLTATFYA